MVCASSCNSNTDTNLKLSGRGGSGVPASSFNGVEPFSGKSGSVSFYGLTYQSVEEGKLVSAPFNEDKGTFLWVLGPVALTLSLIVPQFFLGNAVQAFLNDTVLVGTFPSVFLILFYFILVISFYLFWCCLVLKLFCCVKVGYLIEIHRRIREIGFPITCLFTLFICLLFNDLGYILDFLPSANFEPHLLLMADYVVPHVSCLWIIIFYGGFMSKQDFNVL